MNAPTETSFSQWALVELFGHQRIAGHVSEQAIGGSNFIRVDVPTTERQEGFTKLFGQGAIYSMTLVTEPVARAAAESFQIQAIRPYDIPALRQQQIPWEGESDDCPV